MGSQEAVDLKEETGPGELRLDGEAGAEHQMCGCLMCINSHWSENPSWLSCPKSMLKSSFRSTSPSRFVVVEPLDPENRVAKRSMDLIYGIPQAVPPAPSTALNLPRELRKLSKDPKTLWVFKRSFSIGIQPDQI